MLNYMEEYKVPFEQSAFWQKLIRKIMKIGNFIIVFVGHLINWQKALVCIETKVFLVIVGEIICVTLIAHNKKLHKTKQRICITIAEIIFIIYNSCI